MAVLAENHRRLRSFTLIAFRRWPFPQGTILAFDSFTHAPSTMAVPAGNHRRLRSFTLIAFRRWPFPQGTIVAFAALPSRPALLEPCECLIPFLTKHVSTHYHHTFELAHCLTPLTPSNIERVQSASVLFRVNKTEADWTKAAPYSLVTRARICESSGVQRAGALWGPPSLGKGDLGGCG
jgi:hypothetical protein